MHFGKIYEAGPTRGRAPKAPVAASRLTARAWLEWRWHQQLKATKRDSHTIRTAVASTLEIPLQQQPCDGSEADQHLGGITVLHNQRSVQQHEVLHILQPMLHSSLHCSVHHKQQSLQVSQSLQHVHQHAGSGSSSATASSSGRLQLMRNIKAANSIHQLKQLYELTRSDMDVIHTASMLNRLAHLNGAPVRVRGSQTGTSRTMSLQQKQAGLQGMPSRFSRLTQQQQQHRWQLHLQKVHLQQRQLMLSQLHQLPEQQQQQQEDSLISEYHQHQPSKALQQQSLVLLRCLLRDFMQRLQYARPRQISNALWVIARFRQQAASSSFIQQTAAALLHRLLLPAAAAAGTNSHRSVSHQALGTAAALHKSPGITSTVADDDADSMLWAHATGGKQQQVRRRIRHQLQATGQQQQEPLLSSGSSIDVANTIWAFGRLAGVVPLSQLIPAGFTISNTLDTLEQLCCWHLHTQKPDGTFISSCMVGFAHLGHPVPQLFSALTARAGHNYIKALQSQQVVALAWSCAKLGHHNQQLFSRLLWRAVVVRQALPPQGVSLLLWAAAKVQHAADPRAVSQLLQVWNQQDGSQLTAVRGQHIANLVYGLMHLGQLQQQREWFLRRLLQLVLHRLDDLQPAAIATLLTAVLHVTGMAGTAAGPAGSHRQHKCTTTTAMRQTATRSAVMQPGPADCRSTKQHQGPSAASAGQLGVLSWCSARHSPQLIPFYREISRHLATQLDDTQPVTLHRIIMALAWVGYYDARLYMKLAAAAAPQGKAWQRLSVPACGDTSVGFSVPQMLQLVWAFARYEHPAPGLWAALLPHLAAADDLQLQQLVFLLNASRVAGCELVSGALECLLQLTGKALQQQAALSVPQLVQVAAAAGWLLQARQQQHSGQQRSSSTDSILTDVHWQLQRLVPRLMSAVLSQPQVLPLQQLPQLLKVAVILEQNRSDATGSGSSHSQSSRSVALNSALGTSAGNVEVYQQILRQRPQQPHAVELRRLADLAADQLSHWDPASLVLLLSCHTQELLYEPLLADAYAEELLARIEQCSVQTLVSQLRVLASAAESSQGYSHSQLLAVTARQLHGKLLLASAVQLQDVVKCLHQLGQQDSTACKAATKLLEGCS